MSFNLIFSLQTLILDRDRNFVENFFLLFSQLQHIFLFFIALNVVKSHFYLSSFFCRSSELECFSSGSHTAVKNVSFVKRLHLIPPFVPVVSPSVSTEENFSRVFQNQIDMKTPTHDVWMRRQWRTSVFAEPSGVHVVLAAFHTDRTLTHSPVCTHGSSLFSSP